jgi:hypothetical protein
VSFAKGALASASGQCEWLVVAWHCTTGTCRTGLRGSGVAPECPAELVALDEVELDEDRARIGVTNHDLVPALDLLSGLTRLVSGHQGGRV